MAQRQKILGIKIDQALERDIQKARGGICSKSRLVKEAVLKELARRECLSLDAANRTIGVDGYRTLSYVQSSKDDETTGIIARYDETGSFITHILVPSMRVAGLFTLIRMDTNGQTRRVIRKMKKAANV